MEELANQSTVIKLCQKYGFSFSKSLGQNFLIDKSVCPRIAELGGADPGCGVLEIGAGFGVLTNELCKRAKKVVSVEIDKKLRPVLSETLKEFDNLKIIYSDILKLDLKQLLAEEFPDEPVSICANLPYYVTSPILMALLEQRLPVKNITVMVQKEAAKRLCAKMGTRECGAVTAAVRYYSTPKILFPVSRDSFFPSPKVDSCVIQLTPFEKTPSEVIDEAFLFRIIRLSFQERRKMLINPLSKGLSRSKESLASVFSSLSIKKTSRAEELTLPQFIALANALLPEDKHHA